MQKTGGFDSTLCLRLLPLETIMCINIILNQAPYSSSADLNLDFQLNILDVVSLINLILSE